MNRQIKFRAWDKTYSLMNYKVQVGNTDYADQNYTCNSIWVDYGDNKSVGWMNADDKCVGLMQFINSHDRNGKVIYESDLLKAPSGLICEVFWNEYELRWSMKNRNDIYNINCQILEVVGNRFENPELLQP